MAAADKKNTYTAAEVAELIRPLSQSVEELQKENAELKRKLENMNEVFPMPRERSTASPVRRRPMFCMRTS